MRLYFGLICLFFSLTTISQNESRIDTIVFKGLKKIDASFINKLVKVKPGEVYNQLKINTDLDRLNRLPAVAKATYNYTSLESGNVLIYKIVENFTIIPGVRASQATNDEFAFRLSLFEFNFLGQSQIVGGYYERNIFNSFGAYWEAPYLFNNKWGLGLNYQQNVRQEPIFPENSDEVNYLFDNKLAELYLLYEHDFHNNFQLGIRAETETYDYISGPLDEAVGTSITADKINIISEYENNHLTIDYQYISGYRNLVNAFYAIGGTGLLDDALVLQTDSQYFKKIGARGNWANRLKLAYATFNDTPFAPFTLDNQLNIRGAGNVVGRGTAEVTLNTEYRHTLYEKDWFVLQSNAFIDAGAWRKPNGDLSQIVDGTTLKVNPGIGIRFIHKRIFNAVIRFDYGVGIGANATNGFVFGIGQYF